MGFLSIPRASLPSSYFGVPLFFGSPKHGLFDKILDSIKSRLAGWKLKFLSFAGRLALIKHVLSLIPLHISLAIPIPRKTCLLIERLMRNFLWLASPDRTKSNYVKREKICLSKKEGGLGLRRMKEFNEACLLKLGWAVASVGCLVLCYVF